MFPSPNTGDELDELVTHFNNMVKKIEVLINGMKDSLDNVAHDLRTPMTRLRGTAEMALGQGSDENSLREALADCIEESERILSMLDTLMDISEAETGVMPLELQRVGVSAAVEYVLDLYGYVAEEKKIDTAGLCPEDLYVYADPLRLRQILSNLLDNGVKYTEPGGKIEIEAERVKGDVKIVVRDTGVGIEAEDLDKIWDRLYRCDESRTQKGLGLGLSLVKSGCNGPWGPGLCFKHSRKGLHLHCFTSIQGLILFFKKISQPFKIVMSRKCAGKLRHVSYAWIMSLRSFW